MADPHTQPHEQGEELIAPSYSDDEQRLAEDTDTPEAGQEPESPDEEPDTSRRTDEDIPEPGFDMKHRQYQQDPREAVEIIQDNFRREGLR